MCGFRCGFIGRLRSLQLFELELKLFQLHRLLLALAAEDHAAVLLDDQLQMFDQFCVRLVLLHRRAVLGDQQSLQRFNVETI